jgi:D-galactarolactone isomerase
MPTPAPTPALACDCHIHLYDESLPLAPTATFKPPHAPLSAYRRVQAALGLQRVVLVQPTGYGFDNRFMLEGLAQLGAAARGVCTVPEDVSDSEVQRLHDAGVRGVRFMMIAGAGGPLPWSALERMSARIAARGWCINLQLDGRDLPLHAAMVQRLPSKVVIDHIGKFLEPMPVSHPSFKVLLDVLDHPNRWIKLAAPYETSKLGPPDYADVGALAKALLQAHPDRCVWASNWPHPNRNPPPSEADLLALLGDWAGDDTLRRRVLVANPEAAFGF